MNAADALGYLKYGAIVGPIATAIAHTPAIIANFANDTSSAWVVHSATIASGAQGRPVQLSLDITKTRDCKLKSLTIDFADSSGTTWPVNSGMTGLSLPIGTNATRSFPIILPQLASAGVARATITYAHESCSSGKDSKPTSLEPINVLISKG